MSTQTAFTDEIADKIIEKMSDGLSLREICCEDGMPSLRTVFNQIKANPDFEAAYTLAQGVRASVLFDEMIQIADDGRNDYVARQQGDDVVMVVDHDHVTRSRLRVDARKWILSKMEPKRFGDRQIVESTSEVRVKDSGMDLSKLTREERAIMRELILKAEPTPEPPAGGRH